MNPILTYNEEQSGITQPEWKNVDFSYLQRNSVTAADVPFPAESKSHLNSLATPAAAHPPVAAQQATNLLLCCSVNTY